MTGAPVPGLESAFEVEVLLGALEDHGETRRGHRRVVPVIGGSVRGLFDAESTRGRRRLADRPRRRLGRDRSALHVARRRRRPDPGPLARRAQWRPRGDGALAAGEPVDPSEYYFRTLVTLESSTPDLVPLQDVIFVAAAVRRPTG